MERLDSGFPKGPRLGRDRLTTADERETYALIRGEWEREVDRFLDARELGTVSATVHRGE